MTIRKTAPRHRLYYPSHTREDLSERSSDSESHASKSVGTIRRLPRSGSRSLANSGAHVGSGLATGDGGYSHGIASGVSSGIPRGVTLSDYIELPFIHWRLIVGCFLASIVVAILAMILWPRAYESEAKLLITVGRESVGLDPTATTSQTLMLQKTQEEEINSALEVLSSRQVAELVVDKLSVDSILSGYLPESGGASESTGLLGQLKATAVSVKDAFEGALLGIGVKDPISSRERAVRKVTQSVSIFAPKRSTAITIHAVAKSPEMAQALAAATTYGFLDRHQSVNFNEGSRRFFLEQSEGIEKKLDRLLSERSEFMRDSKVVSTEDQRRMLTDQMGSAERDILVARGELKQAQAEIEDLVVKASQTAEEIVAQKDEQTDQTWSGMRQRVYELEIIEQSFASMYSDDNPKLINARQQLDGARQILEDLDKDRTNRSLTPNPVRIGIEHELQQLQTRTVGLKSMLAEKEKQREELNAQIDELLRFELKLNEMNRNVALLENSLGALKSKLEEARVIDELQAEHISNVSIYQPASLVERPISPQKPLIAVTFPVLGLMVGLGLALIREFGNPTLRTVWHVQALSGSSLLAAIPFYRQARGLRAAIDQGHTVLPETQCHEILSEVVLATADATDLRGKAVGVLGVDAGCGASSLAAALAMTSSRSLNLQTLLVDADAKQASVTQAFKRPGTVKSRSEEELEIDDHQSARSIRNNRAEWNTCDVDVLGIDTESNRHLLNADPETFSERLAEYRRDYDLIVVDLPPASRPDRTSGIARQLDYLLVVIESEKTEQTQANRLIHRLSSQPNGFSVVLNKVRRRLPKFLAGLVGQP